MASTIVAGNITNGGTAVFSDSTGILEIKTGTGSGTTALTLDASQNVTAAGSLAASGFTSASTFGFKNRIINGAMVIDQRNAGASVTPANGDYTLDRWKVGASVGSKFSVQQNSGSVTPPAGFINYLGCVSLSSYTVGSAESFFIRQNIEGLNVADLAWGTASAATVTLSFWVRSSLTGTFGGVLKNVDSTRSYPYTYTISSANTWEQKTVTIAGDTTGTWLTTNGTGIILNFGLGAGSTASGTAGAWAAANYNSATGATSVVGTSGATFYITGVQLEKGSTATSFDYRTYGTELSLCQRYFEILRGTGEVAAVAMGISTTAAVGLLKFVVTKRAAPTMASSATAGNFVVYTAGGSITCSAVPSYSLNATEITVNSSPLRYTTLGSIATNQSLLLMILGSSSDYVSASAEL